MKIKTIMWAFTLLIILTVLAGLFMYYNAMKTAALNEDKIVSETHINNINNSISQLILRYNKIALTLSRHKEIVLSLKDDSETNRVQANQILDLFNSSLETSVCYLLNTDGIAIASSNRNDSDSFLGNDYSFRPYYKESMKGHSSVYLAYGVTSGQRGIYFSKPVYAPDSDSIVGVAVIKEEADKIENDLLFMHYPTHVAHDDIIVISNEDGVVFISDRKDLLFSTIWQVDENKIKHIAASKQFGKGPWPWAGFKKTTKDKAIDRSDRNYNLLLSPIKDIPGWKIIHFSDSGAISERIYTTIFKVAGYVVALIFIIFGFVLAVLNFLANKAEKELLKEKNFSKAIIESIPGMLYVYDDQGTHILHNKKHEEMTGYSAEELSHLNPLSWYDDEVDILRVKAAINDVFTKGYGEVEVPMQIKNGEKLMMHFTGSRLIMNGNKYFVGVGTDITERKKAEKEIHDIADRLKLATRAARLGIWDWDIQNNKLIWDDTMYSLYGLKKDKFTNVYEAWLNGLHPDDRKENDRISEQARRGEKEYDIEFRILWPDGTIRFIKALGQVTWNSDGLPIRMIGINYDITERKEMESHIQQSQKMESIGTLAGGIAHDFNNILFPIVGHTEMLLEDVPDDSPYRESINEIHTGSLRARDLVHQILAFSRQGTNDLKLMKMQPIIKEALKLIRSTIPTTISINQNLQSDCGAVKADPTQIHQIVMNLTTNAYHAMEENGGELKVNLKEIQLGEYDIITPDMLPGVYACLTVADTGVGMDKNLIDKIFEPFFTTKEKGKGTGMGLSVIYGIVKGMNGTIQVYSEPDKGTQFHIYLPVVMTSSVKEDISAKEPLKGGTERVLLVDDEKTIITMEKLALERLGYHVTSRTSSVEALEAFRANPDKFDLIITDMAMPKMPGDKLATELIKIRPDIPILLCTGFSESMSEEKAASIGIKGFLLKPIVMKDLSHTIREVLDKNKIENVE